MGDLIKFPGKKKESLVLEQVVDQARLIFSTIDLLKFSVLAASKDQRVLSDVLDSLKLAQECIEHGMYLLIEGNRSTDESSY